MTGTPDLMAGFAALDDTRNDYLLRWAYYAGKLPERFSSERIQALVERSADTQYRFRFAKVPINVMRNRVQVASIVGESDAVTARIEQIREANDMDMIEPFMHERLFTYGDVYALVWPVDPEDEDVPAKLREAGASVTYQSPLSVRAMYATEDGTELRYVIRRWKTSDPLGDVWHAELYYPNGTIEPWICTPGANGTDPEQWEPEAEHETEWPVEHDYGMPIVHGRTSLPYGRPEHADAMGPQDALTKLILTQTVVDLEAHGWPERWELIKSQNPDLARDSVPWTDNAQAPTAPTNGTATTGRRSGPGTRHILEGRDATGEYSSPDPGQLVTVSDQWLRFMSVVTETPAYEYDPAGNAGLSGIARMWADRPAAAREQNLKRFLLRFYRGVYGKALEIVGLSDALVDVKWEPPGVINDPDWWAVANLRRDHGVPQEVILVEANYPPEQVKQWLDEDDEARTLLQRITMVEKLGTALQTLGSAVALGVIDQVRVDTLVAKILGERVIETEPVEPPAPAVLPVAVPPREIER